MVRVSSWNGREGLAPSVHLTNAAKFRAATGREQEIFCASVGPTYWPTAIYMGIIMLW
jgi:hypothetical protein